MKKQPNSQAYSGVDGLKAAGGSGFNKAYGGVDSNAHLSDGRGGAGGYDIKKPYGGVDPGLAGVKAVVVNIKWILTSHSDMNRGRTNCLYGGRLTMDLSVLFWCGTDVVAKI